MKLKLMNYKYGNYSNKTYQFRGSRETWIEYIQNFANSSLILGFDKYNFNRRNGVYAQLEAVSIPDHLVESINYCLVEENDGKYNSVWFVSGYNYIRKGLYRLDLKRDLLSENIAYLANTTGRVVRGFVDTTKRDVRLLAPEPMSATFIKRSEYSLYDDFGSTRWLTLFVSGNWLTGEPDSENVFEFSVTEPVRTDYDYDYETDFNYKNFIKLPDSERSNYTWVEDFTVLGSLELLTSFLPSGMWKYYDIYFKKDRTYTILDREQMFTLPPLPNPNLWAPRETVKAFNVGSLQLGRTLNNFGLMDGLGYNNIRYESGNLDDMNNKVLKLNDGFYRMEVKTINVNTYVPNQRFNDFFTDSERINMAALAGARSYLYTTNYTRLNARANQQGNNVLADIKYIDLIPIQPTIPIEGSVMRRANLALNEPYKILTMPLSDFRRVNYQGQNYNLNSDLTRNITNNLLTKYSDAIVDAQITPYCPSDEIKRHYNHATDTFELDQFIASGYQAHLVTSEGSTNAVPIFNIINNNVTFTIPYTANPTDYKRAHLFNKYRLVSGSYKSTYDFNYVSNDGINGFRVNMTTRPFNTFIFINHNYNWLYGYDFNDLRGLVISEDMSITRATDAWEQYQMNNLNYQNSFNLTQETDRNLMNVKQSYMDKDLNVRQWETAINGAANAVKGGAIGAQFGAGAAAIGAGTAVVSGVTSMITSDIRNENAKAEQREMLGIQQDTARRQFGMFLENLQHMPQNITKVTGFHTMSKFHPMLEFYSISEQEIQIFNEYFKYNGYKLDVMGTLSEYLFTNPNYDYIQFIPYIVKAYANMELNQALTELLASGVYIMYNDNVLDF